MNASTAAAIALDAEELATEVSRSSPDHGPRHWRDVARVGLELSTLSIDGEVLFLFAAMHDTQRHTEFSDPDHGQRAADFMRTQELPIGEAQIDMLHLALVSHDKGTIWAGGDPTTSACWDADRLTLGRVGITPSARYMSLSKVRNDLRKYVEKAEKIMFSDDQPWAHIANAYAGKFGWPDA
jgi:uncharacterized protein